MNPESFRMNLAKWENKRMSILSNLHRFDSQSSARIVLGLVGQDNSQRNVFACQF